MIYFIQIGRHGPIKIGYTAKRRVSHRKGNLQTANPCRLRVRLCMGGDENREAVLHRFFAYAHIRGEWFRPAPQLLDYIDRERGTKHPDRYSLLTRFLVRYGLENEPTSTSIALGRLAVLTGMLR